MQLSASGTQQNGSVMRRAGVVGLVLVIAGLVALSQVGSSDSVAAKQALAKARADSCVSGNFDGEWDVTPGSPAHCDKYVGAIARKIGTCLYNIELISPNEPHYVVDATMVGNQLHESTVNNLVGSIDTTSSPPVLTVKQCRFKPKAPAPVSPRLDFGGWTQTCETKLRKSPAEQLGARSHVEPKLANDIQHLRFISRGWDSPKSNYLVDANHVVVEVDMDRCEVKNLFLPTEYGEFHPAIRDDPAIVGTNRACTEFLVEQWRKARRSQEDPDKLGPATDAVLKYVPLARDGYLVYTDNQGRNRFVAFGDDSWRDIFKVKDLYGKHRQAKYTDKNGAKKLAFLYENNVAVIADYDGCQVSRILMPTLSGDVNPLL